MSKSVPIPEAAIETIMTYFERHLEKAFGIDNWTGDINNLDNMFEEEGFIWLLPHIRDICAEYMKLVTTEHQYFEYNVVKSWPVILQKGGSVHSHKHANSHLSVVYYMCAGDGQGGELIFERPMEHPLMTLGLTGPMMDTGTSGVHAVVEPQVGKLIVFPSSMFHSVNKYLGERPRLSLSADIILTKNGGEMENQLTNPRTWIKL